MRLVLPTICVVAVRTDSTQNYHTPLSHPMCLQELESKCIQGLAKCIAANTVLDILEWAEALSCSSLIDACHYYLRNSNKIDKIVDEIRRRKTTIESQVVVAPLDSGLRVSGKASVSSSTPNYNTTSPSSIGRSVNTAAPLLSFGSSCVNNSAISSCGVSSASSPCHQTSSGSSNSPLVIL